MNCTGSSNIEYTLEVVKDYYPYGKILREYVNGEDEKYISTQHQRDKETGLDYRSARFYDGDIARFLSLDPHAVKYPSLSDYVYVADNRLAFIDEDGKEFTPAAKKYAAKIRARASNKISSIEKSIKVFGFTGKTLAKEREKIQKLNDVLTELGELEKSEQKYDFQVDGKMEENGKTTYKNGIVTAVIKDKNDIKAGSHEFKHLHQFEKGQISFVKKGSRWVAGGTYDLGDEVQAFERGELISGRTAPTIEKVNKHYGHTTFTGKDINLDTLVGILYKSDKRRFKIVFGKKPKKRHLKMTVGEYMKMQNESGKQEHKYKKQKQK